MEQLVNQITERTGISEEQARQAVQVVTEFVKSKLPAPLASQVEAVLNGDLPGDSMNQAGKMLGGLGGMFGNKN